jgi:hypothetical protein
VRQAVEEESLTVAEAVEIGKLPESRSQKRAFERMRGLHGHGVKLSLDRALQEERRALAGEATYKQACEQVQTSGWPRVTNRPSYATADPLHRSADLKAHQKGMPCYAVFVEQYGAISHYCTKPRSHGKAKADAADPEAETRRERSRAMKARTAAAAELERLAVPPGDVPSILARAAIRRLDHAACMKLACSWLRADGVELPEDDYAAERGIVAGADQRLLIRLALAMILANREVHARWTHSRWQDEDLLYVHELATRVGYVPTPWERDRIKASGVLDVDAFLSAADPLPHLPAQPTLHDDLGTEPATQVERVELAGDLL